jgi:hypothetical protein
VGPSKNATSGAHFHTPGMTMSACRYASRPRRRSSTNVGFIAPSTFLPGSLGACGKTHAWNANSGHKICSGRVEQHARGLRHKIHAPFSYQRNTARTNTGEINRKRNGVVRSGHNQPLSVSTGYKTCRAASSRLHTPQRYLAANVSSLHTNGIQRVVRDTSLNRKARTATIHMHHGCTLP